MLKNGTALIIFLLAVFQIHAQTVIQDGDVYGEWNVNGSPYLINGNITVPSNQKLTIKPGVNVIFQGQYYFEIIGRLNANGAASDSINFTVQDTTGYYLGNHNGWYGFFFNGTSSTQTENSILEYCNIEYSAGSGISCLGFSNLSIENCIIKNNLQYGINLFEFSDIMLDGIIITGNKSGGMSINFSAPQVTNFTISGNYGSGVTVSGSAYGNELTSFIGGIISENNSSFNGGGISVLDDAYVYIENVEIVSNFALYGGGAYCGMGGGIFKNVILSGNTADYGGGINSDSFADITLDHALIVNNNANVYGGGAYVAESSLEIVHATISNNNAGEQGGGIYYEMATLFTNEITNSIIWDNLPDEIYATDVIPGINYSDVKGGYTGSNNIDTDPLFADPENGDYHLLWINFPEADNSKSPCIDSGDPNSSYDPDGTVADMGAFFFNQENMTYIKDNVIINDPVIYPNPAYSDINLKGTSQFEKLVITTITGQRMKEVDINTDYLNIDISEFESGIHLINLYNQRGSIITKKFIKK
ncbi:MAG: right-handed parallel beta-helix repeat-containing protein [Bacteroidetes bacterium]|nr:right-handed parallel beta-helix repeat-containing protein [Bacteroidota bacterium]MBL7103660.1 right-handed parallel beta-helix repeat-containing protein [Bacteroidales bacterium]